MNEATIRTSLAIRKTLTDGTVVMDYSSRPTGFNADVTGTNGPTPGAVAIATSGTIISFAQLTTPGLCRLMNMDDDNYVTYGIWDPALSKFYPLGELQPGESYVLRLSRFLQTEIGTGTGTVGGGGHTTSLKMYAQASTANVLVEAFEK